MQEFLLLCVASIVLAASASDQPLRVEAPDAAPWSSSLNGAWEFAPEESLDFRPAQVPGYWSAAPQCSDSRMAAQWKGGVYRREFPMPREMTSAVLEFESIRWGGEVLVNAHSAGRHTLGFAPAVFEVGKLVHPGLNRLEVRSRGWPALPRFPNGDPQIPCAAANWWGGKSGGLAGDVTLRFHRGAWIGDLRIVTRVQVAACQVTARLEAGASPWKGRLAVQVLSDDRARPVSAVQRAEVSLKAGQVSPMVLPFLEIAGAAVWSQERPVLHRLVAWLETDGQAEAVANVREEAFGLREVEVREGRFLLNGRPVALHGVTGVAAYDDFDLMADGERLFDYQVRQFKGLNAAAFRGHMNPLHPKWLELCDRNGILVIAEFPHFPDVQCVPYGCNRNPYDEPVYVENLKEEIRGLLARRMNHPAIVAWSASNEGNGFGDWERANLVPFVKSLDPTRPVMLSADVSADFADQHNFLGNWYGTQGEFDRTVFELARAYPERVVGCSEFGQFQGGSRWYGVHTVDKSSPQFALDHGQLLMEQVEVMRRARLGLIMPFCYPVSREGRIAAAGEPYHALRNALSPLAVSLEVSVRRLRAGSKLEAAVWVLSDAESASGKVKVSVALLDRHPGFQWNGQSTGLEYLTQEEVSMDLAPWQAAQRRLTLTLPERAGSFTLAAVLRREDGRMVSLSIRPLQVCAPLPALAKPRVVGVIEKDGALARWLRARGHRVVLPYADPCPEVVLIGEGLLNDGRLRAYGFSLSERVKRGVCRLVILEQQAWDPQAFSGILAGLANSPLTAPAENLFPCGPQAALLGAAEDYRRLNGQEGIGLRVRCQLAAESPKPDGRAGGTGLPDAGPSTPARADPLLPVWSPLLVAYTRGTKQPDWAIVRGSCGKGEVFACQVPLAARLDPGQSTGFDSVAERLLALLVESAFAAPAESEPGIIERK